MKRFLAILLVTFWLSLAASAQEHTRRPPTAPARPTPSPVRPTSTPARTAEPDTGGWVHFNSELGRFSVLVPKMPEENKQTTPSDHGPYTTHLFIARDLP